MTKTVAFIFARGGSKGLSGKNLRPLRGKSLIAHAIDQAKASRYIDRVVVSTDDPEIAEAARAAGAEVPFLRPADLAGDRSPEWLAWRHALEQLAGEVDEFVCVPTTSPLRAPCDIDACIERFRRGDVDTVMTVTPAQRSPWFNMVTVDEAGHAARVIEPEQDLHHRQTAPPVFDVTTVCYVADPAFIMNADGLFAGRVGTIQVPAERAVDIDTEVDLRVAEALYDYAIEKQGGTKQGEQT